MPDLSRDGVMAWLRERDPVAAQTLAAPDPIDSQPLALRALQGWAAMLDGKAEHDPEWLSENLRSDTAKVFFEQIGTARRLRLIEWVREAGLPDHQAIQDAIAIPSEMAALRRLDIVRTLFAADRLERLVAALEPRP